METLSARDIQDLRETVVRAGLRANEAEANAARVLARKIQQGLADVA